MLLKRSAEADARDSKGSTALMAAAANGHERVAEMLLRHGAEINLQYNTGVTALMFTARTRRVSTLGTSRPQDGAVLSCAWGTRRSGAVVCQRARP